MFNGDRDFLFLFLYLFDMFKTSRNGCFNTQNTIWTQDGRHALQLDTFRYGELLLKFSVQLSSVAIRLVLGMHTQHVVVSLDVDLFRFELAQVKVQTVFPITVRIDNERILVYF